MLFVVVGEMWYGGGGKFVRVFASSESADMYQEADDCVDAHAIRCDVDADVGDVVYVVLNEMEYGGGARFVRVFSSMVDAQRYAALSALLDTCVIERRVEA